MNREGRPIIRRDRAMTDTLSTIFDDLSSKSVDIRLKGERAFYARQADKLNDYLDRVDSGNETLPPNVSYNLLSAQLCALQCLLDILDARAADKKIYIK